MKKINTEIKNKSNRKLARKSWLPVIMIFLSVLFLILSRNENRNERLLETNAVLIEAVIIKKDISVSDEYEDKYYLSYKYNVDSDEYIGKNRVMDTLRITTEVNDTVTIRIVPGKPNISKINSEFVFKDSDDYIVIAFAFFITGIMFIIIPFYKPFIEYLKEKTYRKT